MGLKLRNKWNYEGNDRWNWEAFLDDAGSGELSRVDYVEYVLHPTFPNPIRRIDDPADGFPLRTHGWGEFTLKAFAHMKDGSKQALAHDIKLEQKPESGVS